MKINVERFITGPIETNTYIVYNELSECLIVDPSSGCEDVISFITKEMLKPLGIIITHGHFDHIIGIPEILARFSSVITYIHPGEKDMLTIPRHNMSLLFGKPFNCNCATADLSEGIFTLGGFNGRIYVISGHSPAGCALHIDNYLLCGDILFAGGVGRSDFPGGSHESLIAGIKTKLMTLADETVVCPGHGGRTTIGRERRLNPYL